MFNMIAMVFAVLNGVPTHEDPSIMKYKVMFPTMEACQDFMASEDGKKVQAVLTGDPAFVVIFKCVPSGASPQQPQE